MNASNETKTGILVAVAVCMGVIGYNFLKGRFTSKNNLVIYAAFDNVTGLPNHSAPVVYKGLQIGTTGEIKALGAQVTKIVVPIRLNKKILLPVDAKAHISGSALGISSAIIEITPGSSQNYVQPGDTLQTEQPAGLLKNIYEQLGGPQKEALNRILDKIAGKPVQDTTAPPPVIR